MSCRQTVISSIEGNLTKENNAKKSMRLEQKSIEENNDGSI